MDEEDKFEFVESNDPLEDDANIELVDDDDDNDDDDNDNGGNTSGFEPCFKPLDTGDPFFLCYIILVLNFFATSR